MANVSKLSIILIFVSQSYNNIFLTLFRSHYLMYVKWVDENHLLVGWMDRRQDHVIVTMCNSITAACHLVRFILYLCYIPLSLYSTLLYLFRIECSTYACLFQRYFLRFSSFFKRMHEDLDQIFGINTILTLFRK